MQIELSWNNRNEGEEGVRIYKSESPFSRDSLPAIYASLPAGSTSFTDTQVVRDKTYFYRISVFKGSDEVISHEISAHTLPYSGPGSQSFQVGDAELGFYGIVSGVELIDYQALNNYLDVTPYLNTDTSEWLKVSRKGKVLFIAKQPINRSNSYVTWNKLYSKGLIFGVDGPGPREHNTLPEVNQLRLITIHNQLFKIRTLRATPEDFDPETPYTLVESIPDYNNDAGPRVGSYEVLDGLMIGSEWNDIMYKFISMTPNDHRGSKFSVLGSDVTTSTNESLLSDEILQELSGDGLTFRRGRWANQAGTSRLFPGYLNKVSRTTEGYWRPVLELVS